MTRMNRIGPDGNFSTIPQRGGLMGNRGILHDADGAWGGRKWAHRSWVSCVLDFKGRKQTINAPGRYTQLFFLDEAVALSAGHRPCHSCRGEASADFLARYHRLHGTQSAAEVDKHLNAMRCQRGGVQVRFEADAQDLPAGSFVLQGAQALLLLGQGARAYLGDQYGAEVARPTSRVTVLTPAPIIAVLADGYQPQLHSSATNKGRGNPRPLFVASVQIRPACPSGFPDGRRSFPAVARQVRRRSPGDPPTASLT